MKQWKGKPFFKFANPERKDGALHWVPDDFPAFFGDRYLTLADGLILALIKARHGLSDPDHAPRARELIARLVQALHGLDPQKKNKQNRLELMLNALEAAADHHRSYLAARDGVVAGEGTVRLDNFLNAVVNVDLRMQMAESIIRGVLPAVKVPKDVLERAVELWPKTKQREARSRAIHDLARAIGCDSPTLLTQLRQARKRLRDRRIVARRK